MTEMQVTRGLKRVSWLDLIGGGQVVAHGNYAFAGHMKPPHGTSIIDVSDPKNPRLVTTIMLPDQNSHTHKVRVAGYTPEPANGFKGPASNDVFVDRAEPRNPARPRGSRSSCQAAQPPAPSSSPSRSGGLRLRARANCGCWAGAALVVLSMVPRPRRVPGHRETVSA